MDITLSSLKTQTFTNFETLVSDNASTDNSVDIIKKHIDNGLSIKYKVNPTNIGFAGNLDKVGELANSKWMIMLSSDDVVKNNALEVYNKFISLLGNINNYAFCSTFEKIDGSGNFIEYLSPTHSSVWLESDIDLELSKKMGFNVYKVKAAQMLKRCLTRFLNPFNFASTCYPHEVYKKVGGYGGGRLYNPDKWFHWKIMVELEDVYYLDCPLFQYRWHNNNQANQQQKNQILKFWMDEYRNCFEVTNDMLIKSNISTFELQQAFINRSIIPYIAKLIVEGNYQLSKRIFNLGKACYPYNLKRNKYYIPINIALSNRAISYLTRFFLKCFITKR